MNNNNQFRPAIQLWLGSGSIILFGVPFSGKDTQSKNLADFLNAKIIASGDILRNLKSDSTVVEQLSSGQLVATDLFRQAVLPFFDLNEYANLPLILNSVGRWIGEEKAVIQACQDSNHPIKLVFHLQLDESCAIERWHKAQNTLDRGIRADDSLAVLAIRLKEFREKTMPVINEYSRQNLLVNIDANQSRENVFSALLRALVAKTN